MKQRWQFILVLLFAIVMIFPRLSERGLWASHEARAAQNTVSLLDDSPGVLPHLFDGQTELQKPPGYYWLSALAAMITGDVNEWSVRLPAALAALLTVLAIYGYLVAKKRPLAGFIAALMLVTLVRFTGMARVARIDMPLTAAITCGLLVWHLGYANRWSLLIASPFIAFAVLLKGPIGFALPAVVVLAVYAMEKRRPPIGMLILSFLVIAGLSLPWFVWANRETDGEFFRVFVWYHNIERALGGSESLASYPWWFYLPRLLLDAMPWTPLFVVLLVRRSGSFGLWWFLSMLVLLSCSKFKRVDYLLPALPGLAIYLGCGAESLYSAMSSTRQWMMRWVFLLVLMGCVVGWWGHDRWITPKEAARLDPTPFAKLIREQVPAPEPILLFRVESHLLAFELGHPVLSLVEWHHLNQWLQSPGEHSFVLPLEFVEECQRNVWTRGIVEVARSESVCPKLHRPIVLMRTSP